MRDALIFYSILGAAIVFFLGLLIYFFIVGPPAFLETKKTGKTKENVEDSKDSPSEDSSFDVCGNIYLN